jgi:hypothetical protein
MTSTREAERHALLPALAALNEDPEAHRQPLAKLGSVRVTA